MNIRGRYIHINYLVPYTVTPGVYQFRDKAWCVNSTIFRRVVSLKIQKPAMFTMYRLEWLLRGMLLESKDLIEKALVE